MTRAEIQKRQQQLLLKNLAKKVLPQGASEGDEEEKEEKHSFDSDEDGEYRYRVKPNVNHMLRDQAEEDASKYSEVIDGFFLS